LGTATGHSGKHRAAACHRFSWLLCRTYCWSSGCGALCRVFASLMTVVCLAPFWWRWCTWKHFDMVLCLAAVWGQWCAWQQFDDSGVLDSSLMITVCLAAASLQVAAVSLRCTSSIEALVQRCGWQRAETRACHSSKWWPVLRYQLSVHLEWQSIRTTVLGKGLPWFGLLGAGFSPRRPGFSPSRRCGVCGQQSGSAVAFWRSPAVMILAVLHDHRLSSDTSNRCVSVEATDRLVGWPV